MSAADSGRPAFPCALENNGLDEAIGPGGVVIRPGDKAQFAGMTLRAYIASRVLQGMVADHTNGCDWRNDETYEEYAQNMAESAVILADALIVELAK